MDPGGIGALIGISVMIGVFVCIRIHDSLKKLKQTENPVPVSTHSPLLVRKQSKLNTFLPK